MQTPNNTTPQEQQRDIDAIIDNWDKLAARIDGLGKGFGDVGKAADDLFGSLEKLGGALGTGIGLFKTHIFEPGLDMGKLHGELGRAMETTDEGEIKRIMSQLEEKADAYGMPLSKLVGVYMELRKEKEENNEILLKLIADLAAGKDIGVDKATELLLAAKKGDEEKMAELAAMLGKDGEPYQFPTENDTPEERQKALSQAFIDTKIDGTAEIKAETWDGLITRLENFKNSFAGLVMDNGVLTMLENQLKGLLAYLGEMRDSGELKATARSVAKAFCDAIDSIVKGITSATTALKKINEFMGGWENTTKAVVALLAMPALTSLLSLTTTLMGSAMALAGAGGAAGAASAGMAAGGAAGMGMAAAGALGGIPYVAGVLTIGTAVFLLTDRLLNPHITPDNPYPGLLADDAEDTFLKEYVGEGANADDMAVPGLTLDPRDPKEMLRKDEPPRIPDPRQRFTPLTEAWPVTPEQAKRNELSETGTSPRPALLSSHGAASGGRILPDNAERLLAGAGPGSEQTVRTEVRIKGENLPSCLTLSAGKTEADHISVDNAVDRGMLMGHAHQG